MENVIAELVVTDEKRKRWMVIHPINVSSLTIASLLTISILAIDPQQKIIVYTRGYRNLPGVKNTNLIDLFNRFLSEIEPEEDYVIIMECNKKLAPAIVPGRHKLIALNTVINSTEDVLGCAEVLYGSELSRLEYVRYLRTISIAWLPDNVPQDLVIETLFHLPKVTNIEFDMTKDWYDTIKLHEESVDEEKNSFRVQIEPYSTMRFLNNYYPNAFGPDLVYPKGWITQNDVEKAGEWFPKGVYVYQVYKSAPKGSKILVYTMFRDYNGQRLLSTLLESLGVKTYLINGDVSYSERQEIMKTNDGVIISTVNGVSLGTEPIDYLIFLEQHIPEANNVVHTYISGRDVGNVLFLIQNGPGGSRTIDSEMNDLFNNYLARNLILTLMIIVTIDRVGILLQSKNYLSHLQQALGEDNLLENRVIEIITE